METRENNDAPTDPSSPESTAAVDLELATHIERTLTAFVHGGNPTQELLELDTHYAAHPDAAQVETTARQLFHIPAAFDNLNFHSSLLADGSLFFGLVLRRMGELADAEPRLAERAGLPVLIRLTEHFRRKGDHEQTERHATRVEEQLQKRVEAHDPLALAQLAKVRYEQSMGQSDQGHFARAIAAGEEASLLSEQVGDLFGVLTARGNTAGRCRYEWARTLEKNDPARAQLLAKGRPVLEADLHTAQEQRAKQQAGSLDAKKFDRVEMNNAEHLMHIANLQEDGELARRMMTILWKNPLYCEAFDPKYPGDPEHAQAWAKPYPAILARLEVLQAEAGK